MYEGEGEKRVGGCERWWITHLHRKRVLKELGWSLRLMSVAAFCCFCFDTFLYFQKHNNSDDAYLNNKHQKKTFFYNFNMFRAAVRREIIV
jgi:hypothetical protein